MITDLSHDLALDTGAPVNISRRRFLMAAAGASAGAFVLGFGLLLHLATTGWLPFLNAKPLVFLGAISYPLYLIHQNIGLVLLNALGAVTDSAWLRLGITVAAMIVLAWVISVCIERPSMRWVRDRMRRFT